MKVIYVMCASHSGSTVIDAILGNHPHIEGVGEVIKLHRSGWLINQNRRCACGSPVHECPYWLEVRQRWSETNGDNEIRRYLYLQRKFEHSYSGWIRLLWEHSRPSAELVEYMSKTRDLYKAIQQVSGKSVVVDSSENQMRAYALNMNPNIDLRLIYLVRDGRGCVWSKMKPKKQDIEGGIPYDVFPVPSWRTTIKWISHNLRSSWVFNRISAEKRQRVRYEDFVTNPSMILNRMGTTVSEDLSYLAKAMQAGQPLQLMNG
jgi:hypothetical protein